MEIKWSKRNLKRLQATNTTRKNKTPSTLTWMKEIRCLFTLPTEIRSIHVEKGLLNVSDPHTLHQDTRGCEAIGRHNKLRAFHPEFSWVNCVPFFWLGISIEKKNNPCFLKTKTKQPMDVFHPKKNWNSQELFQQPNFGRKKDIVLREGQYLQWRGDSSLEPLKKNKQKTYHVLCIMKTNDSVFSFIKKNQLLQASSTNKKRLNCISTFPDPTLCPKSFSLHGKGIAWFLPLLGKSPLEKGYTCTLPGCVFLRDST